MKLHLRAAWNALRGYAAAQENRASAWSPSGGSANGEVGMAAASVARRARDAVRNDPYAARIVDLWTGNAVGAGITTRWPENAHRLAWQAWADSTACDAEGKLDLYGLQALAMRAVVESGECFIRLLTVPTSARNPIGLSLQVLESDHLDTARNGMVNGAPTIQGIALGNFGEPIGYWLFPTHPGAWMLPGARLASNFIPAHDVLHIFRKRRPGQLRDVSWLAPILLRLRDLGDYEAALLMKAKIEACLAAVVTDESEETLTTPSSSLLRDSQGRAVESFEPGMILYRRGHGEVNVVNPSGGGSHTAFARRSLEAAAVGAGLTYDQVSGDLTQANYSSLRAGKIEFRRLCEQVQYGMLIPMLVRPIHCAKPRWPPLRIASSPACQMWRWTARAGRRWMSRSRPCRAWCCAVRRLRPTIPRSRAARIIVSALWSRALRRVFQTLPPNRRCPRFMRAWYPCSPAGRPMHPGLAMLSSRARNSACMTPRNRPFLPGNSSPALASSPSGPMAGPGPPDDLPDPHTPKGTAT
jgi:lambda family phage portal protein